VSVADPFLSALDRAFFSADEPAPAPPDPLVRDRQLTAMERAALDGPSWRVKPYPGPLDLLLQLEPTYTETAALRTVSDFIVDARDRLRQAKGAALHPEQLMVSLAPQEGKSSLVVYATALWLLMDDPDRRVIIISYEKEIATRWGRAIRTAIQQNSGEEGGLDLGLRLRMDTWAADRWQLEGARGGVYSVGIGGAITGRPGDVVIVDDPFKDKAEARSPAARALIQERWRTVIQTRLQPGSLVIVSHTRWHEQDLIGWLRAEFGHAWRYLNIPALATARLQPDPLDRDPGEWLTSTRGRTDEQWQHVREVVGEYDFAALYQGTPQPAAGGLFRKATFNYWRRVPAEHLEGFTLNGRQATAEEADPWRVAVGSEVVDLRRAYRFLTADLAASTRTSADWSVAAAWAIDDHGRLLLLDLWRERVRPEQHWDHIGAMAARWACPIFVEKTQHATDLTYSAGRGGVPTIGLDADSDKFTRAIPAAARVARGEVFFPPSAPWWGEYEAELLEFPNAAHDDQVDVTAYASRVRSAYWTADQPAASQGAPTRQRPDHTQRALDAELGTGVDYSQAQW
jgi:predicted phage terminase large subunit-like protein